MGSGGGGQVSEGGKGGAEKERERTRIRIKTSKRKKAVVGEVNLKILKAESSTKLVFVLQHLPLVTRSHTVAEVTYDIAYFPAITAPLPITRAPFSRLSILRPRLSPRGSDKGTCLPYSYPH